MIPYMHVDKGFPCYSPGAGSVGAAGIDLCSSEPFYLPPGESYLVSTNLAFAIPQAWYGQIKPRSSLAVKGITVDGGVIDSDYRGEVRVLMVNRGERTEYFSQGTRIAQMVIIPCRTDIHEVDSLDGTERGTGGFGSTGR